MAAPGGDDRPAITVIVTAHDRREFLLEAVRSVVAQEMAPAACEILVVKNFSDPELDPALDALGALRIETDLVPLGAKIALGVARARADIVTFLEDDDTYLPGRLARLADQFRQDRSLGYVRNGERRVDAAGHELAASAYGPERAVLVRMGPLRVTSEGLPAHLGPLSQVAPDFNLSCIALRREIAGKDASILQGLEAAVDSFLFYAALRARATVLVDPTPETQYRVHGSNASLIAPSTDESLQRNLAYVQRFLRGFAPTLELCEREGPDGARRLARAAFYGTRVLFRVASDDRDRASLRADLRAYWRAAPWALRRARKDIPYWGWSHALLPGGAAARYRRRRSEESVRQSGRSPA
ncbi:MAG: glycosyltransferase family 2 protein [Thermoplasmata archaeon]|nr:glycosyltransferase family 2 protein [Thermoplasmata archaeon]